MTFLQSGKGSWFFFHFGKNFRFLLIRYLQLYIWLRSSLLKPENEILQLFFSLEAAQWKRKIHQLSFCLLPSEAILKWFFWTNKPPTFPRDLLLQLKELRIPLLNTKPKIKQGGASRFTLFLTRKVRAEKSQCDVLSWLSLEWHFSAAYSAALILNQTVYIAVN